MRTYHVEEGTPKSRFRRWHIPVLLALVVGTVLILRNHNPQAATAQNAPFQTEEGMIFGTVYHVKYQSKESLKQQITDELNRVDASLSMFNPQSTISRINRGESSQTDSLLQVVWALSQQVCEATDGAFDPTCAPLVNAWGFGYKNGTLPTDAEVDSLRALVGWQRVGITDGLFHKDDDRMVLDFSAVAKGFGVDQVARMLAARGIQNYMVEIGGEVVTHGKNPEGKEWSIGINKPVEDPTSTSNELQEVIRMTDCALATSGNYRNFRVENGMKIAHTIDPRSGRPVQHSLLSSTVWAPTCAMADAFATSFMVMGIEKAKVLLEKHPELKAYFIYADAEGNNQVWTNYEL